MATTTITFRTEEKLKTDAAAVFEGIGMNMSVAINMFLKQAVLKQGFPCPLELNNTGDCSASYPAGFFELFGSGKDLEMQEPEELPWALDGEIEL